LKKLKREQVSSARVATVDGQSKKLRSGGLKSTPLTSVISADDIQIIRRTADKKGSPVATLIQEVALPMELGNIQSIEKSLCGSLHLPVRSLLRHNRFQG
jgi:hypothetical protein